MRPYVAPTHAGGGVINPSAGFERFNTLGGYSDANSGPPTKEQLDLSLKNAMNIYWNIYSCFSVAASASISNAGGESVSKSFGNNVLKLQKVYPNGLKEFQSLTPKERANASAGFTFDGGQFYAGDGEEQSTYGVSTTSRFKFELVRMMDRTNASSPLFLGYGLRNLHTNIVAGATADAHHASALIKVGSFFNRNPDYVIPSSLYYNIPDSKISNISLDGMPYLSLSETVYFSGDDEVASSSTSSHSASISLNYGPGDSLQVLSANCSINGGNTFYTYST